MQDRSSRPLRQPTRTPQPPVRKILHIRGERRLGSVGIAGALGVPPSTVHAVLRRGGISRLSPVDRATGEPVRRYEHERPGDLLHVDVEKLGKVPDGGGWRCLGKQQGDRNRARSTHRGRSPYTRHALLGHAYVHTVVDDHSRVAYRRWHPSTGDVLVRRPRRHSPACAERQRRLLTEPPLAPAVHRPRHHPRADRPYRPQTTARSSASTAP